MAYGINLNLPRGWKTEKDSYIDESGEEITHLEACLAGTEGRDNDALIDIYAGSMPEGETAEDQAFANYAETVGFDGDDEESPISSFKFNGKNAWGFEAVTEEDYPMRFIAQEVRKGLLVIIVCCASSEEKLSEVSVMIERNLRVK